ncbi:MAG TPA: tRNA lysidine(34) synthetase TilS [Candidatus Bathyarchaeia archaeon]|nr:tRNA lysidine(34) synthetase TilS [Candidatus Bathyarchaeia archaeon]
MDSRFAFEKEIERSILDDRLVERGGRVLVAVSGGPDSMALLAVLHALAARDRLDLSLAVAHLNHRLRGSESDRDAAFVAASARGLGLECFVAEARVGHPRPGNLEAQAREARYAFLGGLAARWRADAIALGHTRDDQAETVLLRLARGAGTESLAAMRPRRADGVIRPLLGVSRAAAGSYLARRGWPSVRDRSNEDESFLRNRVRRHVLPFLDRELGPGFGARLARLASELRVEVGLARQVIDGLLDGAGGQDSLPIQLLLESGPAAGRLLHAWLARGGVRASSRQVVAVAAIARGREPAASVVLAGGARVRRCYDVLRLERGDRSALVNGGPGTPAGARGEARRERVELPVPGAVSFPRGWRLTGERRSAEDACMGERCGAAASWDLDLDAGFVGSSLLVRSPAPGDRIRLTAGRRKLADVLIDAHVPRAERPGLAIVTRGDDIVWVPGVVASVIGRPAPTAREMIRLHAEREVCRHFSPVITSKEPGL